MISAWRLVGELAVILILLLGIRRFRTPRAARSGNLMAAFALACGAAIALDGNPIREPATVVLALLTGGAIGGLVAMRASMIQIPAMVGFQNGAGGCASFLTAFVELTRDGSGPAIAQFSGMLGIVIGAATFSGSMIASAKLAGVMRQTPVRLRRHDWIIAGVLASIGLVGLPAVMVAGPALLAASIGVVVLSLALGAALAIRVGGADMPVLISFLNATSGLAAAFCGIVIRNHLLIACGATVAASGFILTYAMCQAMNRSLFRLLVAADSPAPAAGPPLADSADEPAPDASPAESPRRESTLLDAVEALRNSQTIIVIPGYGMALAHAQFEVAKLVERLQRMGKEVRLAIHPIAGRMPGHMHVLLAEAEIDPDMLFDLREINAEFKDTDLAVIVGACDVVNPAASSVSDTPISGMPILAAQDAKQVLVCNMDDRPGYSGVENPLYADPKTILMLGDAKATLERLREGLE